MNEIVNEVLLAGDKLMPEMHLKQPRFTVLVDHLLKTRKEFKKFKETGNIVNIAYLQK